MEYIERIQQLRCSDTDTYKQLIELCEAIVSGESLDRELRLIDSKFGSGFEIVLRGAKEVLAYDYSKPSPEEEAKLWFEDNFKLVRWFTLTGAQIRHFVEWTDRGSDGALFPKELYRISGVEDSVFWHRLFFEMTDICINICNKYNLRLFQDEENCDDMYIGTRSKYDGFPYEDLFRELIVGECSEGES